MSIFSGVQKALYDLLTGDSELMALVNGVGDWPSPDTAFPYITIGEDRLIDFSDKSGLGLISNSEIHIWSRYMGWREAKLIADRVLTLVTETNLSLPDPKYCSLGRGMMLQPSRALTEDEGRIRHLVLPIRFWIKEGC